MTLTEASGLPTLSRYMDCNEFISVFGLMLGRGMIRRFGIHGGSSREVSDGGMVLVRGTSFGRSMVSAICALVLCCPVVVGCWTVPACGMKKYLIFSQ